MKKYISLVVLMMKNIVLIVVYVMSYINRIVSNNCISIYNSITYANKEPLIIECKKFVGFMGYDGFLKKEFKKEFDKNDK